MPTDASNKEIYFIPIRKPKGNSGLFIIIIIIIIIYYSATQLCYNYVIDVISFFHLVLPVMYRFHPI